MERLGAIGEGAPSLDEKLHLAETLRMGFPDGSRRLDRILIGDRDRLRTGLEEAQKHYHELKQLLDKMTEPPWHIGIFLCRLNHGEPGEGEKGIRRPRI
jgi:hypothetical protein